MRTLGSHIESCKDSVNAGIALFRSVSTANDRARERQEFFAEQF